MLPHANKRIRLRRTEALIFARQNVRAKEARASGVQQAMAVPP